MTRYSFVSDHWQYFGCMSILAVVAAGITAALERFEKGRLFLKPVFYGLLLAGLGVLTWRQCGMYANPETLWKTTLARHPRSFMAHTYLGVLLPKERVDEAIFHFRKALEFQPDFAEAHNNLGRVLFQKGQMDEAITHFQKAVEIQPGDPMFRNNLGTVFLQVGKVDEAMAEFQTALEIRPDFAEACQSLGLALLQKAGRTRRPPISGGPSSCSPVMPRPTANWPARWCRRGRWMKR